MIVVIFSFLFVFLWFNASFFDYEDCIEETLTLTSSNYKVFLLDIPNESNNFLLKSNNSKILENLFYKGINNIGDQRIGIIALYAPYFSLYGLLGV